jgi:hypothetical protein
MNNNDASENDGIARLLLDALPHYNKLNAANLPKLLSREHRGEETELSYILYLLCDHARMRFDDVATARKKAATTLRLAANQVRAAHQALHQAFALSPSSWATMFDIAALEKIAGEIDRRAADMEPPCGHGEVAATPRTANLMLSCASRDCCMSAKPG